MKPIFIDSDVRIVLEFMERNIQADKLVRVAAGVAAIGPVLWNHVTDEVPTSLLTLGTNQCAHELQPETTGSALGSLDGHDGSVAAERDPKRA